jgi:hypothetical protein
VAKAVPIWAPPASGYPEQERPAADETPTLDGAPAAETFSKPIYSLTPKGTDLSELDATKIAAWRSRQAIPGFLDLSKRITSLSKEFEDEPNPLFLSEEELKKRDMLKAAGMRDFKVLPQEAGNDAILKKLGAFRSPMGKPKGSASNLPPETGGSPLSGAPVDGQKDRLEEREAYAHQEARRLLGLDPASRVQVLAKMLAADPDTPEQAIVRSVFSQLPMEERWQVKEAIGRELDRRKLNDTK